MKGKVRAGKSKISRSDGRSRGNITKVIDYIQTAAYACIPFGFCIALSSELIRQQAESKEAY